MDGIDVTTTIEKAILWWTDYHPISEVMCQRLYEETEMKIKRTVSPIKVILSYAASLMWGRLLGIRT